MAAGNVRLFREALSDFTQGIRRLQVQRSIQNANQAVAEIRASEAEEQEKNDQLKQVARSLGLSVFSLTGNVSGAQFAQGAIAPQEVSLFQQSQLDLQQQRIDLENRRLEMGEQEFKEQSTRIDEAQKFKKESQRALFQQQKELVDLKNEQRGKKLQALKTGEINKIQSMDESFIELEDLGLQLQENRSFATPLQRIPGISGVREIVNPQFADFRAAVGKSFQKFRKATTGAQASVQELADLRRLQPTEDDTPAAFQLKLKRSIEIGQKIRARFMDTLRRANRDVESFEETSINRDIETDKPVPQGRRRFLKPIQQAPQAPPPTNTSEKRRRRFLNPIRPRVLTPTEPPTFAPINPRGRRN